MGESINVAACQGKQAHERSVARGIANAMNAARRRGKTPKAVVNAFQCPVCRQWHVGTLQKGRK